MTMLPISACPRGHTAYTDLALVNAGGIETCVLCGAEMTIVTGSLHPETRLHAANEQERDRG